MAKRKGKKPAKSKKARHGVGLILPRGYEGDLDALVDAIYEEAFRLGWTWVDLAREARLSHYTVWRLGSRITKRPSLVTVWKLGKAVGMKVGLVKTRANLSKSA